MENDGKKKLKLNRGTQVTTDTCNRDRLCAGQEVKGHISRLTRLTKLKNEMRNIIMAQYEINPVYTVKNH